MLHKIKQPPEDYPLYECLEFQLHLLEFACDPSQSYPLAKKLENLSNVFPGYQVKWLKEKLYQDDEKLARYIEKLASYINGHPQGDQEREKILQAFEEDAEFFDGIIDDREYRFAYFSLTEETRNAVKPLMEYCYELLYSGIPLRGPSGARKNPGPDEKFTRQQLVDDFWRRNESILHVCPACDGISPFYNKTKTDAHADHFFPKARYPFLSIHPLNLIPICTDCNTFRKGTTDPIEDQSCESLLDTFHPYGRPALEYIEIEIVKVSRGANVVRIAPRLQNQQAQRGQISIKCIKNLDRVLQLTRIWSGNYMDHHVVDTMVDHVRNYGQFARDRVYPKEIVEGAFWEDLQSIIGKECDWKVGMETFFLLKRSYAKYLQSHQQESENIIETIAFARDNPPSTIVQGPMKKTIGLRAKRKLS